MTSFPEALGSHVNNKNSTPIPQLGLFAVPVLERSECFVRRKQTYRYFGDSILDSDCVKVISKCMVETGL